MRNKLLIISALTLLTVSCGKPAEQDNTEGASFSAPADLKCLDASETALTFQWTAVSGASGYDWTLTSDGTQVRSSDNLEAAQTRRNVKIDNLTPGTAFRFGVRAYAPDGTKSSWSFLDASTTKADNPGGDTPGGDDDPQVDENAYAAFLIPETEEDGEARAFPGAEGGGMWATGGRGGSVYHVTNLNDSGPGSLRYGLSQNGPITIVFDVAGTIALRSTLKVSRDNVTIAGQTAPGDGICLKNYTFQIAANNVIVRFIRSRLGDEEKREDDAIQVMGKNGTVYNNIIIDHCSASWSIDECGSFYGMKNFTLQWSILSESLRNSVHSKDAHGYGGLWGGENATYHHNLLAHHDSRNARIDHDYTSVEKGPVSMINNVIYNWSGNSTYGGESFNNTNTYRKYNIVNNYYKPGPATPSKHIWFLDPTTSCSNCSGLSKYPDGTAVPSGSKIVPGHFYMNGNYMDGKSSMTSDNWTGLSNNNLASQIRSETMFSYDAVPSNVSLHSATEAIGMVLEYSGASFKRDGIDSRVADETLKKTSTFKGSNGSTGGFIDSQTDVADASWQSNWPVYSAQGQEIADSDQDGMPDSFEREFGLKVSGNDANEFTLDPKKRYTNLEMYLHYLVKDIVAAQNQNANYTKL